MAWNDKGDNQGPWGSPPQGEPPRGYGPPPGDGPNMDEALRRARHLLSQFSPGGKDGARGLVLFFIVLVLLWMASGIYFVKADEQGVVLRFGQYTRTTPSGLNYHLPWPIETVKIPRVTAINHVEIGFRSGARGKSGDGDTEEGLMLTGDENIVDIHFEVQWKISDAPDFLFNVRAPEETVKAISESAMREVIGKTHIATVLAEGKLQVAQDTRKLVQDTLNNYRAGIEIVSVNLLKADPPAQVIDSFRDVQTALADLETSRNQAEAYRNDILPKARGQAQQIVLDAEGYKQEVVNRAQGEASRFSAVYNEFKVARDVTKKRMYLETMEEILQGMSKIIVDKSGTGVVPYLPLPELKNKAAEAAQ